MTLVEALTMIADAEVAHFAFDAAWVVLAIGSALSKLRWIRMITENLLSEPHCG